MKRPLITLLTDFGEQDHYVAAMKGVILGICPAANIIDITHQIPPFQIAAGAYTLAQAAPAFPTGTVHVAVVDPGVGSARRAIAARGAGQIYVGPDNGLLAMALDAASKPRVYEITNEKLFRHPVSKTFHGRDIFAPVAAHLAGELALSRVGSRLTDWQKPPFLKPQKSGPKEWAGRILSIDHFGNLVTNFSWKEFGELVQQNFHIKIGSISIRVFANTYREIPSGIPFVIRGSSNYLEVSLNEGNASKLIASSLARDIALVIG
jgi:S-adenosylmethionine hydrolase